MTRDEQVEDAKRRIREILLALPDDYARRNAFRSTGFCAGCGQAIPDGSYLCAGCNYEDDL